MRPERFIFVYSPYPPPYPVVIVIVSYVYNIPRVILELNILDCYRFSP